MGAALSSPVIWESFESLSGWANTGAASMTLAPPPDGSAPCLKLVSASGQAAFADKTLNLTVPRGGSIMLDVYFDGAAADTARCVHYLSANAAYSQYLQSPTYPLMPGWNTLIFGRNGLINPGGGSVASTGCSVTGGGSWAQTVQRLRIRTEAVTGQAITTYWRNLRVGGWARPKICWRVDDGHASVYTHIFPRLRSLGFRASLFAISNKVGLSGYMSLAELKSVYEAGWDVCNHTADHLQGFLPTASVGDCRVQIRGACDWLQNSGFVRDGCQHLFANPYGESGTNYEQAMRECGVRLAFSTNGRPGAFAAPTPFRIPTFIADTSVAGWLNTLKAQVLQSVMAGGVAIIGLHRVVSGTPASGMEMSQTDFNALTAFVYRLRAAADVWTLTELAREMGV